ncbi:unnamed protein product [Ambrosiozyma monospora]|uniref:Unnamed protein product n=1 Tax=Ambrosiozyma monospora TaxID=43982 RepID=A0A9W7DIC9_AMBMO|nr:unnamed protein product [Ambrosiozyma monospora]
MFDDDYPYNRPVFHEGGLLKVLEECYDEYRHIYKSIDKKVNLELKERSEDTLTNLDRFIKYKKTELQ